MKKTTDWTAYYQKPYKVSSYTRRITANILIRLLQRYGVNTKAKIAELGGGNSFFYDLICKQIMPIRYVILDNNECGIYKFVERYGTTEKTNAVLFDALNPHNLGEKFNIVISCGLIEHFSKGDTARIINTHFSLLEQGGICVMTFPTPTWSYRITRYFAELLKLWIFYDERPLEIAEIEKECNKYGQLQTKIINNKIALSQAIVVYKKNL